MLIAPQCQVVCSLSSTWHDAVHHALLKVLLPTTKSDYSGLPLQREGASRDVLLLDIALDNYFRLCLERTDKAALPADDLCELIELVLRNTIIAYDSQDFRQVRLAAATLQASRLP